MKRLVCTILAVLELVLPVQAHKAPSGWEYPSDCCNGRECHPVPCDEISAKDGIYSWNGLTFNVVRSSGDQQCHACNTEHSGRCLYIRPTSSLKGGISG